MNVDFPACHSLVNIESSQCNDLIWASHDGQTRLRSEEDVVWNEIHMSLDLCECVNTWELRFENLFQNWVSGLLNSNAVSVENRTTVVFVA